MIDNAQLERLINHQLTALKDIADSLKLLVALESRALDNRLSIDPQLLEINKGFLKFRELDEIRAQEYQRKYNESEEMEKRLGSIMNVITSKLDTIIEFTSEEKIRKEK